MDHSTHSATPQSIFLEPPDLPDGWQSAERADWDDPRLAARKRLVVVRVMLVVVLVAAVFGALVGIAGAHYARGVDALNAHSYYRAAAEFSVARVVVFPYRDAQSMEEQARRALAAGDARHAQAEARRAAVVVQLEKATARLKAREAGGVLSTLQAIDGDELRATLESDQAARQSADTLAEDLAAASRTALRHAAWGHAGRFAAAILVLEPSNKLAEALGARARTGEGLSAKMGRAKTHARRGEWRAALRMALAVLAVRKHFPGAATLVADARIALAPKPKPKPVANPPAPAATVAVSPPQTRGGSGTTTPPPPPPP